MQLPTNINFNNISALIPGQILPSVHGTSEAEKYPTPNNSEVVLKDADDDTLLYIKTTDVNGFAKVKRMRCYEDPEPTMQDLNDQRYVTIDDFKAFKEELSRKLEDALNGRGGNRQSNDGANSEDKRYEKGGNRKFKSNEYAPHDG